MQAHAWYTRLTCIRFVHTVQTELQILIKTYQTNSLIHSLMVPCNGIKLSTYMHIQMEL